MSKFAVADDDTKEIRVPPAVAERRTEQVQPPIEQDRRPPSPGSHDLEACRAMRLPKNWPYHVKTQLPELSDGLEHDEYGVTVVSEDPDSAFRFHAARHSFRSRATRHPSPEVATS